MVKLIISDDVGTSTVVPLVRDEVTIGRKDGNTIRLTERNVSRNHARLHRANGAFKIADLDSYNGITINGERVNGESDVNPGDEIKIGDYTLLVELEATVSVEVDDDEPTRVAPTPKPDSPARLVVLGEPNAGAEYSLTDNQTRLGRSDELEIPINHRSVSREHAAGIYRCGGTGQWQARIRHFTRWLTNRLSRRSRQ